MKTPHRWLFECLSKETHTVQSEYREWSGSEELGKDLIYNDYKSFCITHDKPVDDEGSFWKRIIEILGPIDERKLRNNGARVKIVRLPDLNQAREKFAKFSKEDSCTLWDA